jgi:integrating conjugative element membrane protein (TIGR03747 family)
MTTAQTRQASAHAASASDRGPLGFLFAAAITALVTTVVSWCLSIGIEMVGMNYFWQERGVLHARDLVTEDLGYIAAAPHSVIVEDTVAFSLWLVQQVALPFHQLGVVGFYERSAKSLAQAKAAQAAGAKGAAMKVISARGNHMLATVALVAMYCAQDTSLRLAIVIFALPAFVLACLLGAVDGLMRRDLRKWGGGRESSFIYHHAKSTTYLVLGGGFGLYLAWPTGGFNPAYMVLVFTALVAWSLSVTLSSFKKYL